MSVGGGRCGKGEGVEGGLGSKEGLTEIQMGSERGRGWRGVGFSLYR